MNISIKQLKELVKKGESESLEFKRTTGERKPAAGGSVSVAIFDDRLEISNPGALPSGLTPEDLFRHHSSQPSNPLIAHVFYRRGIIERWGRGTIMMRDLCLDAGLPEPVFEIQPGEILVRFDLPADKRVKRPKVRPKPLREKVLSVLASGPLSLSEIASRIGHKTVSGVPGFH